MISQVDINNFRSIVSATVPLQPFTLLVGANGSGKSNFLRALGLLMPTNGNVPRIAERHVNHADSPSEIKFTFDVENLLIRCSAPPTFDYEIDVPIPNLNPQAAQYSAYSIIKRNPTYIYQLDPETIGKAETLENNPIIKSNGEGAIRVLDALKTGDREDLFEKIESTLHRYIPEVEKLSFLPVAQGRRLQVREKGLQKPLPLSELSEGTRLVLLILTILFQENAPSIIGLEDIDRSLHPRLFGKIVRLLSEITQIQQCQIIATTHNPYFLDEFVDFQESVILVEKENGETRFTPLPERLAQKGIMLEDSLGEVWYSGLIGGVPA